MTKPNLPEISHGFCGSVGNTPLIRLNHLSEATGCEILGKAEFMNPGGSVKDRAALGIIEDAEAKGLLQPGGTIVEGTAGNTGIGLALVGHAKGYKTIIVINNTQAKEKMDLLRALGAEVRPVDPAPWSDPNNYNHIAHRLADEMEGGFWANQFDNTANRDFHFKTTGPEIYRQTGGEVTAFVAAIGTGGTLAGTGQYLQQEDKKIKIVCADPYGAAMWSWFKHGHTDIDDGDSIAEGIGQGRVTKNLEGLRCDDAFRIHDSVMIKMLFFLLEKEGLFLGASAALNVCGAVKQALTGGPGQVITTILCDNGQRYMSKLFNREELAKENLDPTYRDLDFLDQLRK
ncbi:MAG: cysteine synthase A [Opitutales bacterium]|nr:cysteine synthase A [Opitutales bacterium]MCH8540903.1 cysteine synthase A [Opitutales bacterium]